MRILIDECLNWRLGRALTGYYAVSAQKMGWSGRRAAWLSTVGFVFAMLNFVPITYLVTTSHTFY